MRCLLSLSVFLLSCGQVLSQSDLGFGSGEPEKTTVVLAPQCDNEGFCRWPLFDPNVATSVSYVNSSGMAVVFGDINIDTIENFLQYETDLAPGTYLKKKRGVSVLRANRWPNAKVIYKYANESTKALRKAVVDESIENWRAILPFLQFEERPAGDAEAGVTRIVVGSGCSSSVGYRTDNTMQITLANGCRLHQTVHELGHALGLYHEQSRSDRAAAGIEFICKNLLDYDKYTTMDKTCCPKNADDCCNSATACCAGRACNYRFASARGGGLEGGAYDTDSLMHYYDRQFGLEENGTERITLRGAPTDEAVQSRFYPSRLDAAKICELYNTACGGYCGDGVRQAEEECDYFSGAANCSKTCKIERCGDGIIQKERGEECDPGTGADETNCTRFCKLPTCGDGIIQPLLGETCDDGNKIDGDGCSSTCQVEKCGDGIIQAGLGEECDDGNIVNGDGCSSTCKKEKSSGWESWSDPSKPPKDKTPTPTPKNPDPKSDWESWSDPSKPPKDKIPSPTPKKPDTNAEWETWSDPSKSPKDNIPTPTPKSPGSQSDWVNWSDPSKSVKNPIPTSTSKNPQHDSNWENWSDSSKSTKNSAPNSKSPDIKSDWETWQASSTALVNGNQPSNPTSAASQGNPAQPGTSTVAANQGAGSPTTAGSGIAKYTGAADVKAKVNMNWLLGGLALMQVGVLI